MINFRVVLGILAVSALFSSCIKQEFDKPESTANTDPFLPVNCNIRDVADQAIYLPNKKARVLGDTTIYGIVVGDDRSGNLYKKIVIQDSAGGGIMVMLDRSYLYTDYPVGRKIYIKLKGLILVNYNSLPEIAYSIDADGSANSIPSALIDKYVVKATFPNPVVPTKVTLSDLFSNTMRYVNTLVELDGMQFDANSAGVPYSEVNSSTNRYISDCPKTGTLVMYNSNYSRFQATITPNGKGSIIGLASIYMTTPQFTMRDTSDVKFTNPRECL